MKRLLVGLVACCALLASSGVAGAKEKDKRGSSAEAEAMVKKAVALIKAEGREKAFAKIEGLEVTPRTPSSRAASSGASASARPRQKGAGRRRARTAPRSKSDRIPVSGRCSASSPPARAPWFGSRR